MCVCVCVRVCVCVHERLEIVEGDKHCKLIIHLHDENYQFTHFP